jgi:hypothetical protein
VACIGRSASGERPPKLREIIQADLTFDITLSAAHVLATLNPGMTFVYVSGAGTDSTERGRTMWARAKGGTENALLRLPFKAAYMFRPAAIQPMHGVRSKTALYRVVDAMTAPLIGILRGVAPSYVTTTEQMGRAMLKVAREGTSKSILENADINRI